MRVLCTSREIDILLGDMTTMPQKQIAIRPRLDADLPALGEVLVRVHARDGYPVEGVSDPVGWLVSDRQVCAWSAEAQGRPVGHVCLTLPATHDAAVTLWLAEGDRSIDDVVVLGRLFVDPDARGQALGRRLTETAIEYAKEIRRQAVLDVMAKDLAAIRMYESMGWRSLGPIVHEFGDQQTEPAIAYAAPN